MTAFSVVQPALPRMVPSRHNLQHVCITLAHSPMTRPPLTYLQLAKSLSQQLGKWQSCQQSSQLQSLEKVSFSRSGLPVHEHMASLCRVVTRAPDVWEHTKELCCTDLMEEDACPAFSALAMPACCAFNCSYTSQQPPKEYCFSLQVLFARATF